MKYDELLNKIKSVSCDKCCIVGPNNSGKTYILKKIFKDLNNRVLYISEEGLSHTKDEKNKVSITNEYYVYTDEKERGNNSEPILDKLLDSSSNIVKFATSLLSKINHKYLSLGSKKMNNILSVFIEYNLNNLDYILLDEPENSLDDNGIKIVSKLISKLIENGKKVVFVTHSPRLLDVLSVCIDDIYIQPAMLEDLINIRLEDVYNIYEQTAEIMNCIKASTSKDEVEKQAYSAKECFRNVYIDVITHSEEFYRVLFYRSVIILEGFSEKLSLKVVRDKVNDSQNTFYSNGKYMVMFLMILFSKLCSNVICIIDSDEPIDENVDKNKFEFALTKELKKVARNYENISIKDIPHDLEKHLEVNDNVIKDLFEGTLPTNRLKDAKKKYKPYLCYYALHSDIKRQEKFLKIFEDIQDSWLN